MIVRFGYVAMSMNLKNASPSKTMTVKQFEKIADKKAAIRKLERIAQENILNTIRLLKYNRGENIHLYRFSSKLIPLAGHELVEDWDYLAPIKDTLAEAGDIVQATKMRVSFHPDHYTLLNSSRKEVFYQSVEILKRHVAIIKMMNLSTKHRNVLHVGSKAGDKQNAIQRFIARFPLLSKEIGESLLLENDDKTFTAEETLGIAQLLYIPMVLDLHHDRCNPSKKSAGDLWPDIIKTWNASEYPPKIHISSPRSDANIRAHADLINIEDLFPFLQNIKAITPQLDVMIEAKQKDNALFDMMKKIMKKKGVEKKDESTIQLL